MYNCILIPSTNIVKKKDPEIPTVMSKLSDGPRKPTMMGQDRIKVCGTHSKGIQDSWSVIYFITLSLLVLVGDLNHRFPLIYGPDIIKLNRSLDIN